MPDNDYRPDEESSDLARKLAALTITDFRGSGSSRNESREAVSLEMHAQQLGIEAPLRDVSFVLQEFAWQWELAGQLDGRMPCVKIDDGENAQIVPMSLPFEWPFAGALRSFRPRRMFFPFPPEYILEEFRAYIRNYGEKEQISLESSDRVLERLQSGLGEFLAYRIAGFRAWMDRTIGSEDAAQGGIGDGGREPSSGGGIGGKGSPQPSSPRGGVGVEFWCNSPGLTIVVSHAYFIHFLNFGAPSFPVKNTLFAGRYVFEGKGPIYPAGTPRSQVFNILSACQAVTTHF